MKNVYFFLILFLFSFVNGFSQDQINGKIQKGPIKITFIGASITYGVGVENREQNSYPAQLQKMLGENYKVENYGVSGCTMLRKGNLPYWNTKEYQSALTCEPDVVFIDLGGNDSKLINRIRLDEFDTDCQNMIQSFEQLSSHPRVILLLPIVSFVQDTSGIWDPVIVNGVIPHIQQAAFKKGVEVIDLHSLLINQPTLLPDKIHPNTQGATILAKRLSELFIQKRDKSFDVFSKINQLTKISSYYGYPCADFMFNGRQCKVVKPKWTAKGHPWIWRARFWGHEPQTEIALLERGFHVVYCDVAELFGNNEAIITWNHFYDILRRAGLSKKAVMEGMSRGAVYVYNWAAVNPDKVACTYVDNPVLDLKCWPCGLGKLPVSDNEFEIFKTDYHLTNQEQVKQFKGSPIDKVTQIVKGNYPMLILCADADEAVSPDENTLLFEQKVKALNGKLTVFHKPGFKHHPHSLPNPTPIVDFILKSTGFNILDAKN
jgi:lysophospholipase L1-like esterase/dienelactone hydrolase